VLGEAAFKSAVVEGCSGERDNSKGESQRPGSFQFLGFLTEKKKELSWQRLLILSLGERQKGREKPGGWKVLPLSAERSGKGRTRRTFPERGGGTWGFEGEPDKVRGILGGRRL